MIKSIILISSKEPLVIDPTDGQQNLLTVPDVFQKQSNGCPKAGSDPWATNTPNHPTPATPVLVYELIPNDFSRIDSTIGELFRISEAYKDEKYFDSLCLTQSQIINFVQKYPQLLCPKGKSLTQQTYFRFNVSDTKRALARIGLNKDGTLGEVYLIPFGQEFHHPEDRARIVVPKIIL